MEQRHEPHNFMVPIEAKGFGLAHERLVRELCAHLHNFLLLKNGVIRILAVLSTNHSASRLEFIMEAMCACWKTCKVIMISEQGTENVIARVIGGP